MQLETKHYGKIIQFYRKENTFILLKKVELLLCSVFLLVEREIEKMARCRWFCIKYLFLKETKSGRS
jgi:hypothetical protein